MSKTRLTNELTFNEYDLRARSNVLNPRCPMNGRFEWKERWDEKTDEMTQETRRRFHGRYVRCTCIAKHECFQASRDAFGGFRITATVPDVVLNTAIVIKRRKAS